MKEKDQQQIIEEMRKAQAERNKVQEATGRSARGESSQSHSKKSTGKQKVADIKKEESVPEDVRIKQLEEQLKQVKSEKEDLEDQVTNKNDIKSYKEEQAALNSIVRNNDDYHFAKKYTIDGGNKKREIVVKMHAPSVSEQAEIQQEYADLTRGRGQGFVPGAQDLFLAIAYFRVVGDNVPTWFTNIDHTYRTDVLFNVWEDYQDWLNSFLDTQLQ